MRTINLLPKEAKKSDVKGIFLNIVFILLVIVFICVLLLSVFLFDMNRTLSTRINDYVMINGRMENDINKTTAYEGFVEEVGEKEELVTSLEEYEQSWHITLMEISRNMPENSYITYIEGQTDELYEYLDPTNEEEKNPLEDKKVFFSVEGFAEQYNDVLKLVINLKNIPGVGDVWLNTISKEDTGGDNSVPAYSFSITAYWDLEPYIDVINNPRAQQQEEDTDESVLQDQLTGQ